MKTISVKAMSIISGNTGLERNKQGFLTLSFLVYMLSVRSKIGHLRLIISNRSGLARGRLG